MRACMYTLSDYALNALDFSYIHTHLLRSIVGMKRLVGFGKPPQDAHEMDEGVREQTKNNQTIQFSSKATSHYGRLRVLCCCGVE